MQNNIEPLAKRLRAETLDEVVGQEHLLAKGALLRRLIESKQLSSMIFFGPPGCGKTTLAYVIANVCQYQFRQINAVTAGIKDIREVIELSRNPLLCPSGQVLLFIDEIHRLSKNIEEVLYSAMEDFFIDIIVGKDSSTRTIRLDVAPFTLVGATTRAGDLSSPLRNRFGIVSKLEFYSLEQLVEIITRSGQVFNMEINQAAAVEIAKRSRGTPRIANRLFKRVRDFAQVNNSDLIDEKLAKYALEKLQIDEIGLDDVDIAYLKGIIERFNGGPVGLEAIAASIGEESMTLEDVYEPYLLQIGFINRTPRGRVVSEKAYAHLNMLGWKK